MVDVYRRRDVEEKTVDVVLYTQTRCDTMNLNVAAYNTSERASNVVVMERREEIMVVCQPPNIR